jgi:inner membrane protein
MQTMSWWLWAVVGFALLVVEILTPGLFVSLFFGIGALAVAVLVLINVGGPDWLQWVIFPVVSLIAIALFRRSLMSRFKVAGHEVDSLVGDIATPLDNIAARGQGKVELRGSTWTAENVSDYQINRGQRCKVTAVNGLVVGIRPVEN